MREAEERSKWHAIGQADDDDEMRQADDYGDHNSAIQRTPFRL